MRGARFGAVAILTLAVAAIGLRIATLPAGVPSPAPSATPSPSPVARLAPVVIDPSKIPASAAQAAPSEPRAPSPAAVAAPPAEDTKSAPAGYVIRRVLDTNGPIPFGRWFWDEAGVPPGPIVITVDVKASVLSIFRGGYEIGTTAVIYGDDGMPTPLGVFPITQKDAHHVSNLYHAPMPYMLRLTNDGVSIHGSPIAADYATHGCIGVPVAFAKKLFGATKLGDRVIVTSGETLANGGRIKAI